MKYTIEELLSSTNAVARTEDEKARYPDAREVAEWLEQAAEKLAERRAPASGPTAGQRSRRTLRRMFAYGDQLQDDEAGQWIAGAYSLSMQHGLKTPAGNDPSEEYARVHREMYGARKKLVSLPDAESSWQLETSTDHQASIAHAAGRRTTGARGASLRRALRCVFTAHELGEIPAAVGKRRHRSPEQGETLAIVGAFALVTEANVEALSAELNVSPSTLKRLVKEARLTANRFKALEDRIARLERRADVADRRHYTFESDIRHQLAKVIHGDAFEGIEDDDPRSLEERFEAFLASLR